MSNYAISVEGLGKSYRLGHLASERAAYMSLRDTITQNLGSVLRKAGDLVRGKEIVPGDRIEEFWALKDVSFDVDVGDRLGIVGRNGAGKSTLLKVLSRITEPTEGRVTMLGRVASLLEVGTGFHPELTGRENVFLNGAILGMSKAQIRAKFDEIVTFAEIERFIDTPVKRYSSGMYVRLAFSVAAHVDPEILIVDEVLAVGDSRFQQKCLGKVNELGTRGRTVLFVSHNLGIVNTLCNKCLMLDKGELVKIGKSDEVIDHYLHGSREGKGSVSFKALTDKPCSIVGISVIDHEKGDVVESVPFQSPFSIAVDLETTGTLDAILGVAILDASGNVVTTMHSVEPGEDESRSSCVSLPSGRSRITVSVNDNVLRPGGYHLTASLFSRRLHQNFDTKESVLSFSVSDHSALRYFDGRQQGHLFFRDLNWSLE